jgi:hypothetical protein
MMNRFMLFPLQDIACTSVAETPNGVRKTVLPEGAQNRALP